MKTTNCHIREMKTGDVYCGRGRGIKIDPTECQVGESGWLGNPISVGKKCSICERTHLFGGETLVCYEKYLRDRLKSDVDFKQEFLKLKGKRLVCFCKPNPCHTDIMIKILES